MTHSSSIEEREPSCGESVRFHAGFRRVRAGDRVLIAAPGAANQHANRVQVVPLSSKTGKLFPCEALVFVQGKQSKAMADQIMTVAKERLAERLGLLSPEHMRGVDMAIRIQLGLAV